MTKMGKIMKIGKKTFDTQGDCSIMGILNVTPDSFSDGGKWNDLERAKGHVEEMVAEGAAIIDIGGESTRPGHRQISIEEEIHRVIPFIEMVKEGWDVPVSIDSYKSQVVEAALKAGADMVNDVWGFKYDEGVAELVASYGVPCCLMHNRHQPAAGDVWPAMLEDLSESVAIAKRHGVADEQMILDPGVGFGKTYEQNLAAVNRLEELQKLGYPVLLATSRKSMIGLTLDLPADQRLEGTLATTVMGVMKGAAFVRVHDVKENYRIIRMTQSMLAEQKRG